MNQKRFRLIVITAAVLASALWFWWWSGPSVQADRTFLQVKKAIEHGRAQGVLDALHPAYDFAACWPNQLSENVDESMKPTMRLLMLRGLTGLFQLQNTDPFVFTYHINSVEEQSDGTYAVNVSLTVRTQSGQKPLTFTPSLNGQTFILKKNSWWPSLTIVSHQPFRVQF
jgi:hypothetical protein